MGTSLVLPDGVDWDMLPNVEARINRDPDDSTPAASQQDPQDLLISRRQSPVRHNAGLSRMAEKAERRWVACVQYRPMPAVSDSQC